GDINNDGLPDIYFSSNEGENKLYLNHGDMQFEDITRQAGLASSGAWKTGISMADINGDGYLDIYQCRLGNYKGITGKNELFINQGDLTFVEMADSFGLGFSGFSTQLAFFDMENDGDLDAYLLNHSVHTPRSYGKAALRHDIDTLAGDRIYLNEGGYFRDISSQAGIYRSQIGYGLGIGLSDINGDGFTDVFVSNDFSENDYLYLNNGNHTFTESFAAMTQHTSRFSMGNDLADFNNDGRVDLITLDMLPEDERERKSAAGDDPYEIFKMKLDYGYMNQYSRNTLQLNRGNGRFSDIAMLSGLHATDWSWAALFADYDNDGRKDLFISNGIRKRPNDLDYIDFISNEQRKGRSDDLTDAEFIRQMPDGQVPDYFFKNKTGIRFEDTSGEWGSGQAGISNGAAYSDLDNDGDLDVVVNQLNATAKILENKSRTHDPSRHFINIRLEGRKDNAGAIGAKAWIFTGTEQQFFEVYPVRGFQSSVDTRLSVGLGTYPLVDSLRIIWPGGDDTTLYAVQADQFITIRQGTGIRSVRRKIEGTTWLSASSGPLDIPWAHKENGFSDFSREALIPHMNSTEGPALAIADVTGDGLDDIFVGGAKYQPSRIYVQEDGRLVDLPQEVFVAHGQFEDVAAAFADVDQDGDQDLLVVSGGSEAEEGSPLLAPRLYRNDGLGHFVYDGNAFAGIRTNGSCIAVNDVNDDGFPDLFIGGLSVSGYYGAIPTSYMLINTDGKTFIDQTKTFLPGGGRIGMINDAAWSDWNRDGKNDLLVVGEWMSPRLYLAGESGFVRADTWMPGSAEGWWKCVYPLDYDNDGDLDFLAGNLGQNSKLQATGDHPVLLYVEDMDQNGQPDQLLTFHKGGKESLFVSKMELSKQLPQIKKDFLSYRAYADASFADIFPGYSFHTPLQVREFRSGVFINEGNQFRFEALPDMAQFSMLQDFYADDFNQDGLADILSVGNFYGASVQEGWYDADYGLILAGRGNGLYEPLESHISGLTVSGEARKVCRIMVGGNPMLVIARNNAPLQWIQINDQGAKESDNR
ncbi:MAG: VCBS repeat-containing protein, partial [Cyclobacteriaceae bacterium]|nr:VCBS repeat-containing protein [Cyclobacteriaceae bacterium]